MTPEADRWHESSSQKISAASATSRRRLKLIARFMGTPTKIESSHPPRKLGWQGRFAHGDGSDVVIGGEYRDARLK